MNALIESLQFPWVRINTKLHKYVDTSTFHKQTLDIFRYIKRRMHLLSLLYK